MRKSDELSNPDSCMSRARWDEWTFVLLGRDVAAPTAVRAWIEERIRLGKNTREDAQIREAEQWIENVTNHNPAAPAARPERPAGAGAAEPQLERTASGVRP
jgi:hypothetical protein